MTGTAVHDRRKPRAARPDASGGEAPAQPGGWAVPLALAVVHIGLALLAFDPTPHTGGDNAAYISLARSLLEGHGYRELWDAATRPHTLYPPVFPAILALAMAVGVEPWVGLKLVIVAFSALAVALSYLWLRQRSGPRLALGVALVLAVGPGVLELSRWILSDVPFWTLTMLALWGYERIEAGRRGGLAVAVAATVLAYFTRSAGLPLVLAGCAWLALRRRWRDLAILAGIAVPLALLWWLRARALSGGVVYVGQFWMVNPYRPELGRIGPVELADRMWANNLYYMLVYLPVLLFGRSGGALGWLGVGIGLAAAAGWAMRARRPGLAEIFTPLYIGLLYVWPDVWAGGRFLLPALPLILAYAAHALLALGRRIRPGGGPWIGSGAVALVVLLGLPAQVDGARSGLACTTAYRLGSPYPCLPDRWRDFFAIAEWTRENLPDDAVVLSRKPRLFYALSGHRGRIFPQDPDPAALVAEAREAGARHIVLGYLDAQAYRYLIPALARRPAAFCSVHALGGGRAAVFGILPGADTVPDRVDDGTGSVSFVLCPPGYSRASAPSR